MELSVELLVVGTAQLEKKITISKSNNNATAFFTPSAPFCTDYTRLTCYIQDKIKFFIALEKYTKMV